MSSVFTNISANIQHIVVCSAAAAALSCWLVSSSSCAPRQSYSARTACCTIVQTSCTSIFMMCHIYAVKFNALQSKEWQKIEQISDCVVVFCFVQRSSRVVLCYHIVSRHCNHSAFQNLEAPPCLQLPPSSDSDAVTALGMSSGPKKVAFSSALFIENSCLMDTLPRTSF